MEDQLSTCSCGKKSIKGSEYGGSVHNGRTGREPAKSSNLSDISSFAEYQEMSHTLGSIQCLNQQSFQVPQVPSYKKGPSSITSVKTAHASYNGNIT